MTTGIVVDSKGNCRIVDNWIVVIVLDDNGVVQNYVLKNGDQVVTKDINIAFSMLKPKFDIDSKVWLETATLEEIESSKGKSVAMPLKEETAVLYGAVDEMFHMLTDAIEANAILTTRIEALEADKVGK